MGLVLLGVLLIVEAVNRVSPFIPALVMAIFYGIVGLVLLLQHYGKI